MVSNIDQTGVAIAAYFECAGNPEDPKWLKAYLDSGGVWTIGVGTIRFPNGQPVRKGDVITPAQRDEYFLWEMRGKVDKVNFYTRDDVTQSQFNALVDLAYNIGTTALQKSTLLSVVNKNPADIAIVSHFLSWRFDNGKEVAGLTRRRMSDAYLYFTGLLKYDWKNYRKYSVATVNEVKSAITAAKKTNNIKPC
jgi:lysozyme